MKNILAIVAVASCIGSLCRAASPPPVPESLLGCRKLQDDGERVRCYDAQIAKLTGAAAGSSATQAAPGSSAAQAASPTSPTPPAHATAPPVVSTAPSAARFGEETLPPAARAKTQSPQEPALLSSITGLRSVGSQTYAISLANGQVWRQEEASELAVFLRVGDDVRIEKGALGSYHLSTSRTGSKNWVRVTRIQ